MPVSRIWDEDNATWQIVGGSYSPDLSDATYLRLDTANDPLTGDSLDLIPASGGTAGINAINGANPLEYAKLVGGANPRLNLGDDNGAGGVREWYVQVLSSGNEFRIRDATDGRNWLLINRDSGYINVGQFNGGLTELRFPFPDNGKYASGGWRALANTAENFAIAIDAATGTYVSRFFLYDEGGYAFQDQNGQVRYNFDEASGEHRFTNSSGVQRFLITDSVLRGTTTTGSARILSDATNSQASPTYAFQGATNVGMYLAGSDGIRFSAAGVYRLEVRTGKVESREDLVLGVSGHSLGWRFTPSIGTGDFQAYLDDDGTGNWTYRVGTTSSSAETKLRKYQPVDHREMAEQLLSIPLRGWQYKQAWLDEIDVPKDSKNRHKVNVGYIAEEAAERAPWLAGRDNDREHVKLKDGRPLQFGIIATLKYLHERIEELEAMLVT